MQVSIGKIGFILWLLVASTVLSQETPNKEPAAKLETGFRSLFNGSDLTGWELSDKGGDDIWKVVDGHLLCTGKRGTWLRSREQFGDFELRLEYLLKPTGNSGVYIRVPENGRHHGEDAGVEVQILDDLAPQYKNSKPFQFAGSLYSLVPAKEHVAKPAGEWNSLLIRCVGKKYHVEHNGTVVIDADDSSSPELGKRRVNGFIGLQNHNKEVRYRNLRIQTMETKKE